MPFEVFNVGDRVLVTSSNHSYLFIAEVLKGQWSGYFHLRYSKEGAIIEKDGQKKRYHRSLLTKAPSSDDSHRGS